MNNVYYSPEAFGLEIVAYLDLDDMPYSYDMLVVWRTDDGRLLMDTDSGCSCPTPFEGVEVADLPEYSESAANDIINAARARGTVSEDAVAQFREDIKAAGGAS